MNPYKVLNIESDEKASSQYFDLMHKDKINKPYYCLAIDMICNKSQYSENNGFIHQRYKINSTIQI